MENKEIKLSPSKLNLFLECKLCFWLENVKNIHRPAGPFPSLPSGMDLTIKKYFDKFRERGEMPPEIEGKVEGKLIQNLELLNKWRSNKVGINFKDDKIGAILMGAIDECLVNKEFYIPLDFKTRGFNLKEDSTSFYQNQLDCYCLLIEKSGFNQPNFAYLVYFIPEEFKGEGIVKFKVEVKKMKTSPERALKIFEEAVNLLKSEAPSKSHSDCNFCAWREKEVN